MRNLIFLLVMGCSTSAGHLAVLPEAPVHPALENPELMSERDRTRLADFYRRYEIFLKKYKIYKEIING